MTQINPNEINNVHDLWKVANNQINRLQQDNAELARTHEIANMMGKMIGGMKLKLETLIAAKIKPTKNNMPEILSS